MNSAQTVSEQCVNSEFKFMVQYNYTRAGYNQSTKRKQAYPVRGAVEPRGATPSQSERRWGRITCVNAFRNAAIGRRPSQQFRSATIERGT